MESEHIRGESYADVALSLIWIVKKPQFKRNETLISEVNALDHRVLGPIPHMEVAAVLTCKIRINIQQCHKNVQ